LLSGEDIGLFCSGDVDLCSSLKYKEGIIKVLSSFGYFLRIRKYENLNVWTEFCNTIRTNDIWINVMWVPITEKVLAVAPEIDSKFFFNDIAPIKNLNINVPSRTNLLFLCLLHTSVHKYTCSPGMKLNVDIDRLVISGKISWEKIVALAIKYNVKRRIAISLMLASDFLGTPVPQKTIIELGGSEYNTKKAYNYLVGHTFLANKSDEINRFRSFYLAALLHDRGLLIGFSRILFPERKWLSKIYSTPNENNILKEYLLRIKRIFN